MTDKEIKLDVEADSILNIYIDTDVRYSIDYDGAIAEYSKAIEQCTQLAHNYGYLGFLDDIFPIDDHNHSYSYHSRIDSLMKLKADSMKLKLADAYFNRGLIYAKLNRYDQAISDYSNAIASYKKHADAYYNRGRAYAELMDYEHAITDYSKATMLRPRYADVYYNRGNVFSELKDYNRAIADYSKAIALNPEYVDAYYDRGSVYANLNNYELAIADYAQAINLNTEKDVSKRQTLSEMYFMTGFVVQMEQTVRSAINMAQFTEYQAISYYLLALALKLQGKNTKKVDIILDRLCKEEFVTTMSFDKIDSWLAKPKIPKKIKVYIRNKTEILKKHQR